MRLKKPELVESARVALDDMLENLNKFQFKEKEPGFIGGELCSKERLAMAKSVNHECRGSIKKQYYPNWRQLRVAEIISESLGERFMPSGCFMYQENGGMSWHTNRDQQGLRVYFSYAYKPNSSYFRYQDPETQEIITDWDGEGWEARVFEISPERDFWHCVGTTSAKRFSAGFSSGKQFTLAG